jgi:hypothetical protein
MKPVQWAIFGTVWVALLIGGGLGALYVTRGTVTPVGPVVPAGDEALRTIAAIAGGNPVAAKEVGAAYLDFAAVVERTETSIASKEHFLSANQRFQAALWADDPQRPQLPGFSAAANAYVLGKIGADSGPFDDTTRRAAVQAIRDIAKALGV